MTELLDADEMARWVAWKRAADAVWDHVVREITSATGLSSADFSVLTRVVESESPPRQQQLADDLGWQRSRLSRQLTRMSDRGLVTRAGDTASRVVRPTAAGRRLVGRARIAHARAVREALLERSPASSVTAFWKTVQGLSG